MSPNCEFCEDEKLSPTTFSFEIECNSLGRSAITKEISQFLHKKTNWIYENLKVTKTK